MYIFFNECRLFLLNCFFPYLHRTTVRLGEHDLSTDDNIHIDVPIVKVSSHAQYDKKDGHNDIAMLYLEREIEFTRKFF